jgi:4-amino-4-deoxy-L-arabinose transferase-like glycosyltransferase
MKRRWVPYIDRLIPIALAVTCYLLFFHRLGDIGMLGPDEPRYASVAREMFLSGDYITPRLNGQVWFSRCWYWGKPWVTVCSGTVGSAFPSARRPSAFSGVLVRRRL